MERLKNIRWGKIIKRTVIGVVILGAIGAAGTAFVFSQFMSQRAKVEVANSKMIEARAKELNRTLISEEQVKQRVSDNIGIAKDEIDFEKITLIESKNNSFGYKYNHENNRRYRNFDIDDLDDRIENKIKDEVMGTLELEGIKVNSGAIDYQPALETVTAGSDNAENPEEGTELTTEESAEPVAVSNDKVEFAPKYFVKCSANGVHYRLLIDAETGELLSSKVD